MKSTRGIIDVVLLYVLLGVGGGMVLGSWKPLASFHKGPPTQQLTELQAKLDAQQKEAAEAAKAAEQAKIAERAKLEEQIRSAQQDNLGASTALKKVPKEHQTPEVKLAGSMIDRTGFKLGAAIGKLPEEDRQAMVSLIEELLSGKQAEIDEANRKLAALDAQFQATTKARQDLEAQIPILEGEARKQAEKAQETQAAVTAKTEEVKTWANKAQAALTENGSLWSGIKKAGLVLVLIYGAFTFILPGIVKHLDGANPLKSVIRDAAGYLTAPLLYHDARTKLNDSKPPQ